MKLKTWLIPTIAWVVIFIGLHVILGSGCDDGWNSPSIGRSGACSHHGGINNIPGVISFFIATAIALFLFFKLDQIDTNKSVNHHKINTSSFEMESTSAPFNPYYYLKVDSKEISFIFKHIASESNSVNIKIPSSFDELEYLINLSKIVISDIDTFINNCNMVVCDGEYINFKIFDGTTVVEYKSPMLPVALESISKSSNDLMNYLTNKPQFNLIS